MKENEFTNIDLENSILSSMKRSADLEKKVSLQIIDETEDIYDAWIATATIFVAMSHTIEADQDPVILHHLIDVMLHITNLALSQK